jgi:hypothetical protein
MTLLVGMDVPEWFSCVPVHGMAVAHPIMAAPLCAENETDAHDFHEYD